MITKKRLSNTALAFFFIFWLFVIISIIRPFQQNDIITFPHQTRIHYDIYRLEISSSLLSIFLFYRGYTILIETSQQTYIQIEKNDKRRIRYLIAILIPIIIIPVVYAYVYEQDNNNLTQTIIDLALMDEDFEDHPPGSTPSGWEPDGGNWTIVDDNGTLVYYQDDDSDKESLSITTTGNVSWANYTYEVDVKFVEGNLNRDDRGALLLFRYQGGNNYYFLFLKEYLDILELHNRGDGAHLVASTPCTLVPDTWYHVNVTIMGQIVDVSIDTISYFAGVDMNGAFDTGNVAIGTSYYKVMFDNIYVDEK